MSARTAWVMRASTTCQGSGVGLSVLGLHTNRMVERAAARSLIWMELSASVFTGQVLVIPNLDSISATVRASQASVSLWVNITVIIPSGLITLRHSLKISAILSL